MTERKAWTTAQDNALKELYEHRGITKWAEISRILARQFRIQNRSGKQCRERYHNHLHSSIKHQKWSIEEQTKLIKLHNEMGNRWAEISRVIQGRSQNCVKNQFYSILRRGLRKINSIIKSRLKRYKQLQINILYKIVENCQLQSKVTDQNSSSKSLQLKKQIAYYGMLTEQNQNVELGKIKHFCKIGAKKKQNDIKKQPSEKGESQEIQSSEYRDDCPVEDVKLRRNSLYSFRLQKEQDKHEEEVFQPKMVNSPAFIPQLIRTQSLQSNYSHEGISPRAQVASPKCFDIFGSQANLQFCENGITSPRPSIICQSPYFDQLRPSYPSWYQFYPH